MPQLKGLICNHLPNLYFGNRVGGASALEEALCIRLSVQFRAEALRIYILTDSQPIEYMMAVHTWAIEE